MPQGSMFDCSPAPQLGAAAGAVAARGARQPCLGEADCGVMTLRRRLKSVSSVSAEVRQHQSAGTCEASNRAPRALRLERSAQDGDQLLLNPSHQWHPVHLEGDAGQPVLMKFLARVDLLLGRVDNRTRRCSRRYPAASITAGDVGRVQLAIRTDLDRKRGAFIMVIY